MTSPLESSKTVSAPPFVVVRWIFLSCHPYEKVFSTRSNVILRMLLTGPP